MRTSFFSGASEPAAQAPGLMPAPAASAADPLMNCLRCALMRLPRSIHGSLRCKTKRKRRRDCHSARTCRDECESDAFARIPMHQPRRCGRCLPTTDAHRVPGISAEFGRAETFSHHQLTSMPAAGALQHVAPQLGGRSRLRASTMRSATCARRWPRSIASLRRWAKACSSRQADLLHQDALGTLDQLAFGQLTLCRFELATQSSVLLEAGDRHLQHRQQPLRLQPGDHVGADAGLAAPAAWAPDRHLR